RYLEIAVLHLPACGTVCLVRAPLRQVLAVEEHDGVRRRLAGLLRRAERARSHNTRRGTIAVVDRPLDLVGGTRRREDCQERGRGERRFEAGGHAVLLP